MQSICSIRTSRDVPSLLPSSSDENFAFLRRVEEQEEEVNPLLQQREHEISKLYNQMCEVVNATYIDVLIRTLRTRLYATARPKTIYTTNTTLANHLSFVMLVNISFPFTLQVADLNLTFHDAIKAPQVEIDSIMDNLNKAEDEVDLIFYLNHFLFAARY